MGQRKEGEDDQKVKTHSALRIKRLKRKAYESPRQDRSSKEKERDIKWRRSRHSVAEKKGIREGARGSGAPRLATTSRKGAALLPTGEGAKNPIQQIKRSGNKSPVTSPKAKENKKEGL